MKPEQLFFYALGQLTERSKGNDFRPVYLLLRDRHATQIYHCYHSKSRAGIVGCKKEIFTLGVCKQYYQIMLHIGTCPVCGVTYVLHPVESLKEAFSEQQSPESAFR